MAALSAFTELEVKRFAKTFEEIFYRGEATAMASYYTENAKLMADGIAPIQGRPAIERFWQATCDRGKALHMKRSIEVDEIQASTLLSYAMCTLNLQVQTPTGQVVTSSVKDITIWRQQPDGTWQIEVDISNLNPQSAP